MNEGENTGMPTSPDFSSPNTSPDNSAPSQPSELPEQPAAASAPAPAEPVISSAEEDVRPAQSISSGVSTRPRFGFARKFKKAQQPAQAPAQQTVFGNAPEYFNNAVQDIVIADVAAADAKKKRKKIALIALAVVAVLAAGLGIFLLIVQLSKPSASSVKSAFNRYANYVLYGEEKNSDFGDLDEAVRYTIMDKYIDADDDYNERFKELFDQFYEEYNAAVGDGLYAKGEMDTYRAIVHDVYDTFDMDKSFSYDDIVELYEAYSSVIVDDRISEKYESYKKNSDSKLSAIWYQKRSAISRAVAIYKESGCVYIGRFEWSCGEIDLSGNEELKDAIAGINEYTASEELEYTSARINIWRSLWMVRDYLGE